jgi:hypothetical protein
MLSDQDEGVFTIAQQTKVSDCLRRLHPFAKSGYHQERQVFFFACWHLKLVSLGIQNLIDHVTQAILRLE